MPRWLRYLPYAVGMAFGALLVAALITFVWRVRLYIFATILILLLVGIFAGLAYLRRRMPELRWVTILITIGILVTGSFAWIAPMVINQLARSWPETFAGLGAKKVEVDVTQGEAVDPIALQGRIATLNYCREKESIEETRLQGTLDDLIARRRAGTFTAQDRKREAEAFIRLRDIADERRLCQEEVGKISQPQRPALQERPGLRFPEIALPPVTIQWFLIGALALGALVALRLLFQVKVSGWSMVVLAAILLAVAWYLSDGRAALSAYAKPAPAISQPAVEEFRCRAGEEVLTSLVGPDTFHRIWANHPWEARDGATGTWYRMPAGWSSGSGKDPEGLLRVRCTKDGTILQFQKVR